LDNLIIIGKIISAYGVKGWVKVRPFTEKPKNFIEYEKQFISKDQKNWDPLEINNMKIQGQDVIADFGFKDWDIAESSKGKFLAISRDDLPKLGSDEYYWDDLIDLNVLDMDDTNIGKVTGLIETGANDVLVVSGDKERLIPYIPQVINYIDLDRKIIKVDWDKEF
jgi:16S rRNA processing protein RimM